MYGYGNMDPEIHPGHIFELLAKFRLWQGIFQGSNINFEFFFTPKRHTLA